MSKSNTFVTMPRKLPNLFVKGIKDRLLLWKDFLYSWIFHFSRNFGLCVYIPAQVCARFLRKTGSRPCSRSPFLPIQMFFVGSGKVLYNLGFASTAQVARKMMNAMADCAFGTPTPGFAIIPCHPSRGFEFRVFLLQDRLSSLPYDLPRSGRRRD